MAQFGRQDSRLTDRSVQSTFTEIVGTKRREAVRLKRRPDPGVKQGKQYGLDPNAANLSSKSYAVHQTKYSAFDDLFL